jgi:hypothetical protein
MRRLRWGVTRHKAQRRSEGCGGWIFMCLLSLLFLFINVALVRVIYSNVALPLWPDMLRRPRVEQATIIVLPAALIFLQWWLLELLAEWTAKEKGERP